MCVSACACANRQRGKERGHAPLVGKGDAAGRFNEKSEEPGARAARLWTMGLERGRRGWDEPCAALYVSGRTNLESRQARRVLSARARGNFHIQSNVYSRVHVYLDSLQESAYSRAKLPDIITHMQLICSLTRDACETRSNASSYQILSKSPSENQEAPGCCVWVNDLTYLHQRFDVVLLAGCVRGGGNVKWYRSIDIIHPVAGIFYCQQSVSSFRLFGPGIAPRKAAQHV